MIVFKFGGASVKDAAGVRNLFEIISATRERPLVVVVSAMGKTTNALEGVLKWAMENKQEDVNNALGQIMEMHRGLCSELFPAQHPIFETLNIVFEEIKQAAFRAPTLSYNRAYDSLVGYGELISTFIISAYLYDNQMTHQWIDARRCIRTDSNWRGAAVNMDETRQAITSIDFGKSSLVLTQGFIGSNPKGEMTTLGREGSDYTAALFAWALHAESVTLWKDVPGVMSADPSIDPDAQVFSFIPYREAVELTYYGASVIHPKTIKPLENSGIPLYVKSFKNPKLPGTRIASGDVTEPAIPSRIRKSNQILITLKPTDLSFVSEEMIAIVLQEFHKAGIRIHLMQNSALSLSLCVDYDSVRVGPLLESLSSLFQLKYNKDLTLLTVRHYLQQPEIVVKETQHRKILLEQRSRSTAQFVFVE